MERLEGKNINGNIYYYYYYSKWAWKNGRCRGIWQKYLEYLGKLQNIVKAVEGAGREPAPLLYIYTPIGRSLPMGITHGIMAGMRKCTTANMSEL